MMIFGLLVALVTPNLGRLYSSVSSAYNLDDSISRLNALGYNVMRQGRPFTLSTYPLPKKSPDSSPSFAAPLELTEGWKIHADPPIQYHANGVCDGGQLNLSYEESSYQFTLTAPQCLLQLNK